MTLAEKLKSAREDWQAITSNCKVYKELNQSGIPENEKNLVIEALNFKDRNHPDFIPNRSLGKLLRSENIDVSDSAIDRHRSGVCSCVRRHIR